MNLNFNEICRLCLRFCEKYVDLNQTNGVKTPSEELAEKIKFCYSTQVDLSEGLPTKVCYECIQVISYFYLAKKNVVISEQLLRDVLYVRKKLQDEMINKENNMIESDIKMESVKQKTSQLLLIISNKSQNTMNNDVSNNINLERHNISNIECKKCKKDTLVSVSSAEITTNNKQFSDFKSKKKKKKRFKHLQAETNHKLLRPMKMNGCKPKVSIKLKVSKALRSQPKRSSKSFKVDTTEKDTSKTDKTLKEFVVKEIGTVIDTSNILSPDVKRSRKTILAK